MGTAALSQAHAILWKEKYKTGLLNLLATSETGQDAIGLIEKSRTTVYGKSEGVGHIEVASGAEPPGARPQLTVNFYEKFNQTHPLLQSYRKEKSINFQRLRFEFPEDLGLPSLAVQVYDADLDISSGEMGAGPAITGEFGVIQSTITYEIARDLIYQLNTTLSQITTAQAAVNTAILILSWQRNISTGWRPADDVHYYAAQNELYYSVDGGATNQVVGTDPSPFVTAHAIPGMVARPISDTQFRLICFGGIVGVEKATFAYGDVTIQNEGTIPAFTEVTIAASAVSSEINAGVWGDGNRLMMAAGTAGAHSIYLSTDGGQTDPGAAISATGVSINAMLQDDDGNIWAAGSSNAILEEKTSTQGSFVTRVGPSGGGIFYSISRAKNGRIFAGNGQSLYLNKDGAKTAAGWSSLKDFGSNRTVVSVFCKDGSDQVIEAYVDNSGGAGEAWITRDGGATWIEKTATVQLGYNMAAETSNPNETFVIGDLSTSGLIEKLS